MIHILKTDPKVFSAVVDNLMTCNIRKDDRGFSIDDVINLKETAYTGAEMAEGAVLSYTGRECSRRIRHLLQGPVYGLVEGWVIMSF